MMFIRASICKSACSRWGCGDAALVPEQHLKLAEVMEVVKMKMKMKTRMNVSKPA